MKIFLNEKKTLVCHQRPLQNTLSRIKIIVSNESLDKKKKKQFGGFMIFSTDYTAQLRCEMDPSMYQKGQNRNKKLCKEGFWAFGLSLPNQIILNFKIKKLGFFLLCGAWDFFFFFVKKCGAWVLAMPYSMTAAFRKEGNGDGSCVCAAVHSPAGSR